MADQRAKLRAALGASPDHDNARSSSRAFRPGHMNGLYSTRASTDTVETGGRDSIIVAHEEMHTAREENEDVRLDASFNERLLASNAHLLQVLRADEARSTPENEVSFSDMIGESRATVIKELEEERRALQVEAEGLVRIKEKTESQDRVASSGPRTRDKFRDLVGKIKYLVIARLRRKESRK